MIDPEYIFTYLNMRTHLDIVQDKASALAEDVASSLNRYYYSNMPTADIIANSFRRHGINTSFVAVSRLIHRLADQVQTFFLQGPPPKEVQQRNPNQQKPTTKITRDQMNIILEHRKKGHTIGQIGQYLGVSACTAGVILNEINKIAEYEDGAPTVIGQNVYEHLKKKRLVEDANKELVR